VKKDRNKMMTGAEATTKQASPKKLRCVAHDCFVPGFGTFKRDDVVEDPALVAYLTAHGPHPHFVDHKEAK
jgi:hypothetical protein